MVKQDVIVDVSGYITNTVDQTFNIPNSSSSHNVYMVSCGVDIGGAWTDIYYYVKEGIIPRIDYNNYQIKITKSDANMLVNYKIRFVIIRI